MEEARKAAFGNKNPDDDLVEINKYKMEKVTSKELVYRMWRFYPRVYDALFEHLTMSDAGVELEELEVEKILYEIGGLYQNFYYDPERTYYELLGWVTHENNKREEFLKHQNKLRCPENVHKK